MGVTPVPRFWGPGMDDSLFTVGGFKIGVSSAVGHSVPLFPFIPLNGESVSHSSRLYRDEWAATNLDRWPTAPSLTQPLSRVGRREPLSALASSHGLKEYMPNKINPLPRKPIPDPARK